MHGRSRKATKQEDPAAAAAKAGRLRDLQAQLLHFHHNHIYTKEAISVSSKLLEINPEVYTGWNYRKLAFQHIVKESTDPDAIKSAIEDELRVVEIALRRNPKSYGAWYHRKWILSQKLSPANFDHEFRLLDQLLKADARNFHGWNYRRFVARLNDLSEEEALKFTMDMINTNFSNYSAWHNRSILLANLLKKKVKGFNEKEKILSDEFELVRQALFTDPSDQSGWFYHLWLLDQTSNSNKTSLISSFPHNGSKINLSLTKNKGGIFPIVLSFNRPVICVNSSIIKVSSILIPSENVNWKPISVNNSKESKFWMGFLEIFEIEGNNNNDDDLQDYSVEICLDCLESPVELKFSMELNCEKEGSDGDLPFLWNYPEKCDNLQECPDFVSFDQLRNKDFNVGEGSNWNLETLSDEIALFRELSDEKSKFVNLTLARLLIAYNSIKRLNNFEEVLNLFDELIKLDPPHKNYYEDEKSQVIFDQVTSDKETLLKYINYYDKSKFSRFYPQICLRLTGLNLTRIGFTERILWVQMLDLSQNKLRSISGLEAIQLLVCLNLSKNQITSFTSLEPIKYLSSLRVLDLSFNEIGAHTTDTTRYLCSSPLSHSSDLTKITDESDRENMTIGENWEAVLFFQPLQLVQLDIEGNPVADENFRVLVKRVVPSLKWIDGEIL